MSELMFLTLNEVIERYRGQIDDGTLRNWRSMRTFIANNRKCRLLPG
jgi:hypothetical protein